MERVAKESDFVSRPFFLFAVPQDKKTSILRSYRIAIALAQRRNSPAPKKGAPAPKKML
jgi:hypothetical protein